MYENGMALQLTEEYLEQNFHIEQEEDIPTRRIAAIANPPVFKRYFVSRWRPTNTRNRWNSRI